MHHGYGNLDKAINLLDDDRYEFRDFVNSKTGSQEDLMAQLNDPTAAAKLLEEFTNPSDESGFEVTTT